ncbi:Glutamate receptor ionotropic, delta-1 [Liparis tanakae]|uniref:Glutamate receptor ionotropic, delta-1 n=1 Tax=Liparis tanakae TaxID=230148 RepID=A0A4Z2E3G5_9TELE|nr:Glutamate receptor ionotropic, delta-1 [Liparis tanakae]
MTPPPPPQDKEVNLEQVHRRMSSLLDEDLVLKQIPGPSIEASALDIGSMRPSPASLMGGPEAMYQAPGLAASSFLPGEGGPPRGGTLGRGPGSSTLPLHRPPSSMQCKHRAPNGGLFRPSHGQTPMPMAYQAVCAGPTPGAIDPAHSTSI